MSTLRSSIDVASESRDPTDYQFLVGMQHINDEDDCNSPQGLYGGILSDGDYSGLQAKGRIDTYSHIRCGPHERGFARHLSPHVCRQRIQRAFDAM